MQIHELPDVTAIGSGGYFATDNGSQTTKIDYDALAKAIIEQYSASTLAGSAQSVKAALDGIKTDLNVVYGANPIKTLAATDDLLTLDVGMYRVANVLPLNAPSTTYKYGYATKQHRGTSGYTYYEFIVGNGNGNDFKRYYGWQYSNSATSIDWIEMAPQSAVDALNSKFDGNNIQFVNMSGSSGNANNAIRFRGASESETTEHEYVMFGIGSGNRMFGFYAYIRYSSQTITVYSFGDIQCTGSISGDTAIIKVATWMKGFGIVRNKVASIDYTSVS